MDDWKLGLIDHEIFIFCKIADHWNLTPENLHGLIANSIKRFSYVELDYKLWISNKIRQMINACNGFPERTACEICGKLNLFYDGYGYYKKYTLNYVHNFHNFPKDKSGMFLLFCCEHCNKS